MRFCFDCAACACPPPQLNTGPLFFCEPRPSHFRPPLTVILFCQAKPSRISSSYSLVFSRSRFASVLVQIQFHKCRSSRFPDSISFTHPAQMSPYYTGPIPTAPRFWDMKVGAIDPVASVALTVVWNASGFSLINRPRLARWMATSTEYVISGLVL